MVAIGSLRTGAGALRFSQRAQISVTEITNVPTGVRFAGAVFNPDGSSGGATVTFKRTSGGVTSVLGTAKSDGAGLFSYTALNLPVTKALIEVSVTFATTARASFAFELGLPLAFGATSTMVCTDGPVALSSTPTFRGQISNPNGGPVNGISVPFYVDGILDGTATTDASGVWLYTVSTPLTGTDSNPVSHTFSTSVTITVVPAAVSVMVRAASVAPSDIRFDDLDWVIAGSAAGSPFARLVAIDANVGDVFKWELTNSAGGRFSIDQNTGILSPGATAINYATCPVGSDKYTRYLDIGVKVTDSDAHVFTKTMRVRVFQSYADRIGTVPVATDPSTFPGLVLDVNPAAAKVNGGSPTDGVAIDTLTSSDAGAYAFTGAGGTRPVWLANGGNGKPAISFPAANRVLSCPAPALAQVLDAQDQVFTVLVIADVTSTSASVAKLFSIGNPQVSHGRMHVSATNGSIGLNVADPIGGVNAGSGVSILGDLPTGQPNAFFGTVYSLESMSAELNGDRATQGALMKRPRVYKGADSNPSSVTVLGNGGVAALHKSYRVLLFNRILTLRERQGALMWAAANYGTPNPPAWADQPATTGWPGYELDYVEDFNTALASVDFASSTNEFDLGLLTTGKGSARLTPSSGPFAGRTVAALGANTGEPQVYLNNNPAEVPELLQYDTLEFRNSWAIMKMRPAPAALAPYLAGKKYISSNVISRYGAHEAVYGVWEFEFVMPLVGMGGWPALWLYGQQANGSSIITEIDLNEWFGEDPFGIHITTHDSNLTFGETGRLMYGDDQREGVHRVAVEITPTAVRYYYNNRLMRDLPMTPQVPMLKYWLINFALGAGGFAAAPDETTVIPSYFAVNFVKHYKVIDNYNQLPGQQAEATAIVSAMGSTPTARAAAINAFVAKLKGSKAEWVDGTSKSVWDLLTAMVVPGSHSAQASLVDWKTPNRVITPIGTPAPTFTPDKGIKGTGGGRCYDTGINLNSNPLGMSNQNFAQFCVTLDQPISNSGTVRAACGTSTWSILPGSDRTIAAVGGGLIGLYESAQAPGFHLVSRSGTANSIVPYYNGVPVGFSTSTSTGVFDDETFKIGASKATDYASQTVMMWGLMQSPTESHVRMMNRAISEYRAAIGA